MKKKKRKEIHKANPRRKKGKKKRKKIPRRREGTNWG
jgi:hypothetical protein